MVYRWQLQPLLKGGLCGWTDKWLQAEDWQDWRDVVVYGGGNHEYSWMPGQDQLICAIYALQTQAHLHQARIACALELHRQVRHDYPDRLDQLVPAFLSSLPLDPCNGRSMGYERTKAGRYKLWSVALDKVDDRGTQVSHQSCSHRPCLMDDLKGDWIWSYERLKVPWRP